MEPLLEILSASLPILYAGAIGFYLIHFFRPKRAAGFLATPALFITAVVHFVYIVLRGMVYGHHPIVGPFEMLSMVSLSLTIVYLVIERWRKNKSTGLFVLPFAFVMQLVATIWIQPTHDINPILNDTWFGLHTGTVVLGLAAFFLSAIYSVMYLVFERALRKKIFGLVFERLTSLQVLFRMAYGAALVGFLFMTFSIISGSIWAASAIEGNFFMDPKVLFTLVVWVVYGATLLSRYALRWGGRLLVIILLLDFGLLLLSTVAARILPSGWHNFGV